MPQNRLYSSLGELGTRLYILDQDNAQAVRVSCGAWRLNFPKGRQFWEKQEGLEGLGREEIGKGIT